MFGLGMPEIAVIGVIALVIFGPGKLPELGASLGKTIKGFREASEGKSQKLVNNDSAKAE